MLFNSHLFLLAFLPLMLADFFNNRRIVSRLIGPTSGSACAACSSNSSVQRVAPSGGDEQVKAEICASTFAPYWAGLPGRAVSRTACYAPPSKYAARVRQIAVRHTPRVAMTWASGTPRSSAERICARLASRALCSPFDRYDSIDLRSSSLRCSYVCRIANS